MSNSDLSVFLLVDGHSLAFRAYYALTTAKSGALRTSTGIPTSVSFGFLNSLLQVMEAEKPKYLAIAFDLAEPTFRHEADPNYKADREKAPEDFSVDLVNLQALLSALNLTIVTASGYEADDVLATLAQQASQAGYRVKIMTGDRDLFQLVNSHISVLYLDRTTVKTVSYLEIHPQQVVEKLGIKPEQVVDYKALCGDKSDNIPGVRGIGEKTTLKLLTTYGSLEQIYHNLAQIPDNIRQKLAIGQQDAIKSQKLAQLILEVPLDLDLETCQLQSFDWQKIEPLIAKLELNTFSRKLEQLQGRFSGNRQTPVEEIKPRIIDNRQKLRDLLDILNKTQTPVAWDTETTSVEPKDAQIVGIGCCWGSELTDIAYIPLGHLQGQQLPLAEVLLLLTPILENSTYPKVLQNAKFDRSVFWTQGIKLEGVVFDTMLASYVLNPEQSHNLKDLSHRYLSTIHAKSYQDLNIPKGETIASLEIPVVAIYCGIDAYTTLAIFHHLQQELEAIPELHQLLLAVEQPLEAILAAMEYEGIRLDVPYLAELAQQLESELAQIQNQAYLQAGEEFNLDSPRQLEKILFDRLGLDRRKSRKTKTGYSTDHATLEKLQGDHPIIEQILAHRTLAKLKSTYVDALPQLVRADTQRIHTSFNQTITTTGRLSSSNPNLQNIPIRTAFSRKIRRAFIPESEWLLVAADYSQIELRILAHLSQEPVLIEAYQTNQDVHTVTAKLLLDKQEITPEERRLGKIINFGVIYGMGAQKFATEAGVSASEGKTFIDRYRQRYPHVFAYLEGVKQQAIASGFVTTILGRRRYFNFGREILPDSKLNYSDSQLLRAAANAPIQGSSADIIKMAMIKLQEILNHYQARLLLQVHDELVLEMPPQEWEELKPQIKATMENVVQLSVPLVVEVHSGKNWMETK
ncbi:DNA polymerase I [Gloeocapsa sp. PCC 73106]|uniref:DNA polymerase I n=1 Tax=Gloeocapsa sp. PCC 73106 TaxID=102232 RepID=UPI0002AC9483|nr:DNA polymerase I [Gloeocapsa sp. PCC 73106]ELR98293.1 DNA polymerase I [Gloeocapsa sp. PCC 73106]